MSSEGMSAYQPESEAMMPPPVPGNKSTIPKVMGVMHLVIGGLFTVSGLLSLLGGGDQEAMMRERFAGLEQGGFTISDETFESLTAISTPSAIVNGFDLLASILMVIAGVGLIKYRGWGRLVSNVYAVVSLAVKGANCYVMGVLAAPFYEGFVKSVPELEFIGAPGLKSIVLGAVLLTVVYPIVSLVVVNVKAARDSLR